KGYILFCQCPDSRWSGIELVYLMFFHNFPKPSEIRVTRHPLEHQGSGTVGQRPVHNITMTGNPAYIGSTPIHIVFCILKDILKSICRVYQITSGGMYHSLGFPG